jgi:hypothetical protein
MHARFRRFLPVVVLLVPVVLAGCGTQDSLVGPEALPGIGSGLGNAAVTPEEMLADGTWQVVASQKVQPGHETSVVQGSRYTVTFAKGAVQRATTITVMERDPDVVDVQLFPDDATFGAPVSLTVDYSGTSNDPSSSWYHGQKPRFARFDEGTGQWVAIPGSDDPVARTYSVNLTGFSRYALGNEFGGPSALVGGPKLSVGQAGS